MANGKSSKPTRPSRASKVRRSKDLGQAEEAVFRDSERKLRQRNLALPHRAKEIARATASG